MIHQYQLNGYNIVLDVYSGSVHVVDEVAYDIIAMYEAHTADEITAVICEKYAADGITAQDVSECLEDIEELKSAGKLFTEDKYKNKVIDFKKRSTSVKALCLHVAHTCNLNCEYCFAAQGRDRTYLPSPL